MLLKSKAVAYAVAVCELGMTSTHGLRLKGVSGDSHIYGDQMGTLHLKVELLCLFYFKFWYALYALGYG